MPQESSDAEIRENFQRKINVIPNWITFLITTGFNTQNGAINLFYGRFCHVFQKTCKNDNRKICYILPINLIYMPTDIYIFYPVQIREEIL